MLTANEIRQQFLDFFKSKQHTIVPSAPIVVKNDPTLLFTNAGMNQFKDYFLGNQQAPYKRAADTQKCLRVSGKHNDLEEVGVDTYHHTMFEMLGNWSFGDYFKKEAIEWSWELLTEVYKIPKDKLYVTVFEGDQKENLPFDQEAYDEWKKYIAEDRILKGNKKDNFWEMGDTGPCGPCSEIHVDCRSEEERKSVDGRTLVNNDHPQVIEIWNNVFMEFNRLKDGTLQPLPARHVDTGMGFERLVRVLQNKQSNYDTDVFAHTIHETEKIVNKKYDFSDSKEAIAFRVIADHIRAIGFTIADGQLPSNTGAGYVIRRILRRAARYYYSYLDYKQPLLSQLLLVLAKQFENVFPELQQQIDLVSRVVKEEEEAFLRTLDKGIKRFEEYYGQRVTELSNKAPISGSILGTSTEAVINQLEQDNIVIDGKFAFELNDTYGFPIDLTQLMAQEVNASVDVKAYEAEMQQQKNRSRAATQIDAEDWTQLKEDTAVKFVGYDDLLVETEVIKYRSVKAKGKEQFQIVLATTPFYAESGGQVGDTGTLQFGDESIQVLDTKKENDLILHLVNKLPSKENIGKPVTAKVDWERRLNTMYNHTGTHLLHGALRDVLGTHVAQKGSLVSPDTLRFDISHFSKVSDEEIRKVEQIVNDKIRENIAVNIKEMPKEEAMQSGAMALFGEKYGDKVRVVTIDPKFSIELCGGTHVSHTGMIGMLVVTSEAAVAAGVRRIEALTGPSAFKYLSDKLTQHKHLNELLKTKNPIQAIEKLINDKQDLEKRIAQMEAKEVAMMATALAEQKEMIGDVAFIGQQVEVSNNDALKQLANQLKAKLDNAFIILAASINEKPFVVVCMEEKVAEAKNLDAGKIIKEHIAPIIKGGGGGQKTLATAGGQDVSGLKEVIEKVKSLLV